MKATIGIMLLAFSLASASSCDQLRWQKVHEMVVDDIRAKGTADVVVNMVSSEPQGYVDAERRYNALLKQLAGTRYKVKGRYEYSAMLTVDAPALNILESSEHVESVGPDRPLVLFRTQ